MSRLLNLLGRRRRPLPFMIRGHYRRELRAWSLLAIALGAVEGGVAGVLVKNGFAGHVPSLWLNTAVALVTGAPALANISSFFWANVSLGKDKIRFLLTVQITCLLGLVLIAVSPIDSLGLALLVTGAIGTRACWAGVTTVRTSVWRANYPRQIMARMTGRLVTAMALLMGLTSVVLGFALDYHPDAFRWLYPVLALVGLMGVASYRRMRVRHQKRLLEGERALERQYTGAGGPGRMIGVLRADPPFRRYMALMFLFGGGNLMVVAPLILILADQYGMSQLQQMLITSSIPLLMMPLAIPAWSRLLDKGHVVHYRARQSWAFVVTFAVLLAGSVTGETWLLWLGAAIYGIGKGGGVLGWNLGHHDFATPERAAQYMGTHVTLTGVRGLIAPLVGVWAYQWLESLEPGLGRWVIALPLLLSGTGAVGFVIMSRNMRRRDTSAYRGNGG